MTPTLVVPGVLGTGEVFAPQLAALWRHGPVTVASTLVGDSVSAMAAEILLDAPPRFALCGHSLGGFIAFEILRQAPDRVIKLALLSSHGRPASSAEAAALTAAAEAARGARDFAAFGAGVLTGAMHPVHAKDPAIAALARRMAAAIGVEAFARQIAAVATRPDSGAGLAYIIVPTLVMVGADDPVLPRAVVEATAAAIPRADLTIVPGSGHALMLEQPAAVTAALSDWIARDP